MDWNTIIASIVGAIVGAIVSVIIYLLGRRNAKRDKKDAEVRAELAKKDADARLGAELQAEYSKRYEDILSKRSVSMLNGIAKYNDPAVCIYMSDYFKLYSEIFQSHNKGFVDDTDWNMWMTRLKEDLKQPIYSVSWKTRQSNQYDAGFESFVDNIMK